jgi:hypothetical protein
MEHNSDFSHDLEVGLAGEKTVADLIAFKKLEVKTDIKAAQTGNVFVEYASRGKPSGISTTEAEWYVFVLSDTQIVFIETGRLKRLSRTYLKSERDVQGGDSNTSHGILVPVEDLVRN